MRWTLLLLFWGTLGVALASGIDPEDIGDSSCARRIRAGALSAKPLSITVWNYFGRDFNSAGLIDLRPQFDGTSGYYATDSGEAHLSGRFQPSPSTHLKALTRSTPYLISNTVGSEMGSRSEGATLIDRNQYFSLNVMEDSRYISRRLREAQTTIPQKVHPDQMIFVEAVSERSHGELIDAFGEIPNVARPEPFAQAVGEFFAQFEGWESSQAGGAYHLKEGTGWFLSGQPGGVEYPLYLQNEALEVPIDRKKFPFVWEIGRAAQISHRAFAETLRVGLYLVARELILLGGDLSDAYLFGHSLNERIGNIYRRSHRMADFSGYRNSPTQKAHVRTLADALKSIDIGGVNPHVAALIRASEGKLTAFEALKIWLETQQDQSEFLSGDAKTTTFQLRDFSGLPSHLYRLRIEKRLGAAANAPRSDLSFWRSPVVELRDSVVEHALLECRRNGRLYEADGRPTVKTDPHTRMEFQTLQGLREFLSEVRGIEVSTKEKLAPEIQLTLAYRRAVEKLVEAGDPHPSRTLEELNVHFVLLNNLAESLPVSHRWYLHRSEILTWNGAVAFFQQPIVVSPEIHQQAFAYRAADVAKLRAGLSSSPGYYRRERAHRWEYLYSPDLMGF